MSALYDFAQIEAMIPHKGGMCLWDSVLAFDEERIDCRTARHLMPDHPLKEQGQLSRLHLIEFGAQLVAVHGGLLSLQNASATGPQIGYLASVRQVQFGEFAPDALQTPHLFGQAEQLFADESGKLYQFCIADAQHQRLCHGRVMIAHPPSAPTGETHA
ncbi:hypothetical protein [Thiomicrorhabdus cannonii]|uniref:hypothetical protein n=1 Tax=Thiomicrorhabdus cannonii TaxID=2748011 RepID=UPI0015BF0DBC|nr:hypothetical protein [Thiomicrorhabdus cannonii]